MSAHPSSRNGLATWVLKSSTAEAEVCPARGGLVTRFVRGDDEVLFLDEATFADPLKNVRGGVPLLFPVAGPAPSGSPLKQHGFARTLPWEAAPDGERVRLWLEATPATLALFPHDFRIDFTVTLAESQLSLAWRIHNRGTAPMPLHFGLHPYFRVPLESKAQVRVQSLASRAFDNRTKRLVPGIDCPEFGGDEVDLHLLDHGAPSTVLHRGESAPVSLRWSESFETLVLWTLPGQPFVCVEPWSGPSTAALELLHTARAQLAPGGIAEFSFAIG